MSALPAEQPLELDTARIYQLPPREDAPNPILDAPLDAPSLPAIDATLNRPKQKRQRKAKAKIAGKRGRPAKPKEPEAEAPAQQQQQPQQQVATAAPPQHPFFARRISTTAGWAIGYVVLFFSVGAALGFWAIR